MSDLATDTPLEEELPHTRGLVGAFARLPAAWQTATVAGSIFIAGVSLTLSAVAFLDLPTEVSANTEGRLANTAAILELQEQDRQSVRDRDDMREKMSEIQCMLFAMDQGTTLLACVDDPIRIPRP